MAEGLTQLPPAANQTGGATWLRHGKGGDGCAKPRAEGGPYKRGGGEGKGERREGREAGVEERPGHFKTYVSCECCSSVCSKVWAHPVIRGQGRGAVFKCEGVQAQQFSNLMQEPEHWPRC